MESSSPSSLRSIDTEPSSSSVPSSGAASKYAYSSKGGHFAGLMHGDSATMLKSLPSDVFNVAITSPPYFWVRDYGYDDQLGHEDSVEAYIEALMGVFDEVKRTLHPEGVFFLNIGDTYYSGNGQPHGSDPKCSSRNFLRTKVRPVDVSGWDIPKKSMIGVPWKVAFEMQQRGWTLRSSIIWNRCNAFVEPTARDRPYRQYEFVFMFSKTRFYSFDRSKLVEEDVWNIPIERNRRSKHNAAFPSELVRRCVEVASPPNGHVLDPFVGSGTSVLTSMAPSRARRIIHHPGTTFWKGPGHRLRFGTNGRETGRTSGSRGQQKKSESCSTSTSRQSRSQLNPFR